MTKILVIGGTGFIGQRVAAALQAKGITPRIFDLPHAIARAALTDGQDTVAGDAVDAEQVLAAAKDCDGIIHLAGIMTVDCARHPQRALDINIKTSLNVLEAARELKLPVSWLSTAGVYGPQDAQTPDPMTIYGVTKLAVEGLARVYAADYGVPSLGLRPYIVYGPGISSGIAAGPSIALAASVAREAAVVRFSGRVGFVHVDDVARLLVAGVCHPQSGATILTMAGDTRDMTDFLDILRKETGWDQISIDGPALKIPADLCSHPVPEAYGAQPVTTIEQGIAASLAVLRG